jgi:plasmid maintenance system antidote protein VapI
MGHKLPPPHPGDVLLEEFLLQMGMSQYRLAKSIGVSPPRVNQIATVSVASARTRRCGWRGSSGPRRNSG